MNDTFLGHGATFWAGIGAIAVCLYTIIVTITLWFLYSQVRMAAKTFQLDAIRNLQELIDSFREDRRQMFTTFPLEIALSYDQFPRRPPKKYKASLYSPGEIRKMALTKDQQGALKSLDSTQLELARHVIAKLNDIGELIENGIVDRKVFLGKYHVMVIQCCQMVEAVRRNDEARRGGNYGQRLLRMRYWATVYNDISPKHREIPITITNANRQNRQIVYQSPSPTVLHKAIWTFRRWLSWY